MGTGSDQRAAPVVGKEDACIMGDGNQNEQFLESNTFLKYFNDFQLEK